MHLPFKLFTLSLLSLSMSASALLDCSAQISRVGFAGDRRAACDYFVGVNPQGYRTWYDSNDINSKYTNLAYLPGSDPNEPENGVAIHWKVDDEYVHLAVATRAKGWIGFGLAEAGGMIGADMVIFTASKPDEVRDAYTTDWRFPQTDDCSSDWEFVDSHVDELNGFLMFETKRKLNTGDPQDKIIVNDASTLIPAHRVISAWGDTPEIGYHGLNRARGAIRFFGLGDERATFDGVMGQTSEGTFDVRSKDHTIAADEDTEYAYTCVSRQDLIDQGVLDTQDILNIIGFEPVISEGTEAYVHHFIVSATNEVDCSDEGFNEVVYVWAPGEHPMTLPENLGAPLFGENGYQAFEIEVHYNNPNLDQDVIDNSGVRFYWTSQPRQEQMGIMSVGDVDVNLYGQPVGDGFALHQFECPGTCSSLVDQPVTVLREYLHMHETGARITNEQIRDGEVIRSGNVDYWEFDQNGAAAPQQDAFQVLPGDGFRTSCYFNGNDRVFGLASSEEMCMAFLYYYPRTTIKSTALEEALGIKFEMPWVCGYDLGVPLCETAHVQTILSDVEDLNRTFGVKSDECETADATPPPSVQNKSETSQDEQAVAPSNSSSSAQQATLLVWCILLLLSVL